jgi:predicted metal-binding membrane protein
MNLVWVAVIATFVLIEKGVPAGERVGQVAGVILVLAGIAMMIRA